MKRLLLLSFVFATLHQSLAPAAYTISGVAADKTTFLGMLNASSAGGAWTLDNADKLVFTANGNALNNFATKLKGYNDDIAAPRIVDVKQKYPGVLCGAFGPAFTPATANGTQLLDLGDIQVFKTTVAAEPLLDLQSSILLHELTELYADGGVGAFPASHATGITDANAELTALASKGKRRAEKDIWEANAMTGDWTYKFPWTNTMTGEKGFEVLKGKGAYDLSQVARGLASGPYDYSYDGSGLDVELQEVFFLPIPEPSSLALLTVAAATMYASPRRRTAPRQ